MKSYRYLSAITSFYITMQLISDVTAGKLIALGPFAVSVTVLYFPFTYIFSDILTEVYGYAQARRVLWTVLGASVLAGLIYQLVIFLPPAAGFQGNEAYARVLGSVPRILLGGWLAIFAGEFMNNWMLAKMKIWTGGRHLWMRTIGSTIVGQLINTVIFFVIGLWGILPSSLLVSSILIGWLSKVVVEVICTPLTYVIVHRLKMAEQEDYYDRQTDFNPFRLKVETLSAPEKMS